MVSSTMTVDRVLDLSERLSIADQLQLIGLLSSRLSCQIASENDAVDILSTIGLGAELWQTVDTAAYLEEERSSWSL